MRSAAYIIVHQEMRYNLVQFAIVFLLLQCIQGALRRFDTKRHPEDIEYLVKDVRDAFSGSYKNVDRYVNGLPRPRARRQSMGNSPEAYTFYLTDDHRQFARLSYIGEGSKVNTFLIHP